MNESPWRATWLSRAPGGLKALKCSRWKAPRQVSVAWAEGYPNPNPHSQMLSVVWNEGNFGRTQSSGYRKSVEQHQSSSGTNWPVAKSQLATESSFNSNSSDCWWGRQLEMWGQRPGEKNIGQDKNQKKTENKVLRWNWYVLMTGTIEILERRGKKPTDILE